MQQEKDNMNFKEKRIIFFGLLFAVFLYGIYQFFWNERIKKDGIYYKATLFNSESTKGGTIITVSFVYNQKKYDLSFNGVKGKEAIGNQYFIQFEPKNPRAIIFYGDKLVPDCLLNIDPPILGWKEIPTCP